MTDTTVPEATWTALLDALGLPTDATTDTVLATVEDLATTPPPTAAEVAASAGLDPSTLAQLRYDAEQGRTIAAAAKTREINDKISAAVARGAIRQARRDHWLAGIVADPAMADTLASLPDELAVPLAEIGHGQDTSTEVVETAAWFR